VPEYTCPVIVVATIAAFACTAPNAARDIAAERAPVNLACLSQAGNLHETAYNHRLHCIVFLKAAGSSPAALYFYMIKDR
jgi:hypothetical protein